MIAFISSELNPPSKEWKLTDIADNTQLGTTERIEMKERLVEEKFIHEIERTVAKNCKIDRKLANFMFVGPTGSGKSSLMARLLKRATKEISLSTGVCDPVVIVDVNFHSATAVNSDMWEEVEYDLSLLRQMNQKGVTSPPNQLRPKLSAEMKQRPIELPSPPTTSTASSIPESAQPPEHDPPHANQSRLTRASPTAASASLLSNTRVKDTILLAVKRHGGPKSFMTYLKKGASLYLRDTGGQVEFQEMISLLIIGPSIFLFVFRIDRNFQDKFIIEYRTSKSESINRYTSSITTEEALLQCLSSVYAMGTLDNTGVKTYKPLVLIIGTHKDNLDGLSAEARIAELNKHLHSVIKRNGFVDLVQYADSNKDQVMFTVDNTSKSDEDFKAIRSQVYTLISSREEFTIEYPITYLMFCLELQNLERSVLSFEECKDMAAKYGIVGDDVSHLLQFLHLRIGVIHYYDVDGLRHIVVKEPQVLFNKVTNLIIRTFSSKALRTKEHRDIQKGILTASALESVIGREDQLTCQEFLKLLVHLRIIARYPSTVPGDKVERYFIPCVLNHVQESSEEELHTDIMPIAFQFEQTFAAMRMHCPKGLFGVLVTHLIDDNRISFTLNEDRIFKDQVTFDIHNYADVFSLKVFPSHLEVKFFPSQGEGRGQSIGEVCSKVRQLIETSIYKSLEDLHYNKDQVKPMVCFRCEHCSELHQVNSEGKGHCTICCKKTHNISYLPLQARYWYNEGESYVVAYIEDRC